VLGPALHRLQSKQRKVRHEPARGGRRAGLGHTRPDLPEPHSSLMRLRRSGDLPFLLVGAQLYFGNFITPRNIRRCCWTTPSC